VTIQECSRDYGVGMRYSGDEEMAARTYTGIAFSFIGPSKAAGSRFLEMMRKHPQLFKGGAKNKILTFLEERALAPGKVSRKLHEFKSVRFKALGVVATLAPATAFAYLDPNTPGLLYQIFFPLVLAVTLAWRRIKDTVSWLWLRIWRKED
jgi:hypothetical protein